MTIDDDFLRRVKTDEVSLDEYIERINAEADAWAAEEYGRSAPHLTNDPSHWARYGITKSSQLATYLDQCVERERRKP